jgi:predicted CoA-binding protein
MTNYAIIGASNNPEKYGYKVMLSLKELNEKVIPINPKEKEILGEKVFTSLSEAIENHEPIDTAIFIIPPVIGIKVLEEIKKLNENGEIISVWFQPGSSNKDLIDYCKKNDIEFVNGKCIMVEKGNVK